MPYYPYRCLNCKKRFEVFLTYSEYGVKPVPVRTVEAKTSSAGSAVSASPARKKAGWIISQIWTVLTTWTASKMIRAPLGKMMRKMSREMGEDVGPEFNEVIDRLESGQSPDEIESALPDLGGDAGAPGGMDDF